MDGSCTSVYFIRMPLRFHTFFFFFFSNNNPSVSHIWHCSNTPLFRKQENFLFRDALVRLTSSLSCGSGLYFIPGHICVSHIPQEFQPQRGGYVQNWLSSFSLLKMTAPILALFAGEEIHTRQAPNASYLLIGW